MNDWQVGPYLYNSDGRMVGFVVYYVSPCGVEFTQCVSTEPPDSINGQVILLDI